MTRRSVSKHTYAILLSAHCLSIGKYPFFFFEYFDTAGLLR